MTTLTYIPNRNYYRVDDIRLNLISVDLMKHTYISTLAYYLDCPHWIAEDIQNTLNKEQECPLYITIVDDRVYYIY